MKKYKIRVSLECTYDDIIAKDEDDAFIQASDSAMQGGEWCYEIEDVEEIDAESEDKE